MASSQVAVEEREVQLKHLGFVRALTLNAVVLVCNVYDHAKESSGSLKSKVESVEDAVRAVVAPVYDRFKGVPGDLLVFLDHKVDEATVKFEELAPPAAKKLALSAKRALDGASKVAQDLADVAKVSGPLGALSRAGSISKDVAVAQLALMWYKLNRYPVLHGVSDMALPTASHLSEKYNELVADMAAKGYGGLFCYAPLVPVEDIRRAYKQAEAGDAKEIGSGSSSESGSDKE